MKKKEQFRCQAKKSIFKKTCLLFVMWSGLLIGNLRAQSVIADNPNVTLQLSNVTLIEFFNKLTEVTGKNFVYSADILEQKGRVSVAVENERLEKVLDRCLKEKGLEYTFQDECRFNLPSKREGLPRREGEETTCSRSRKGSTGGTLGGSHCCFEKYPHGGGY